MSSGNIILKYEKYSIIYHQNCNCRRKTDCPMDGNCLSECLIFKASISTTTNEYYYGTSENTFKERYNNHDCSFIYIYIYRLTNIRLQKRCVSEKCVCFIYLYIFYHMKHNFCIIT